MKSSSGVIRNIVVTSKKKKEVQHVSIDEILKESEDYFNNFNSNDVFEYPMDILSQKHPILISKCKSAGILDKIG